MNEDVKEFFVKLSEKFMKNMQDEFIRNLDSLKLSKEYGKSMLRSIERCVLHLDLLLQFTEEVGGFGSYYPKKCLDLLKTFKTILEMELNEKDK